MNKKILFFDTETTGNTTKDYLCQLAIKEAGVDSPVVNNTYKPPILIPIECTMIHGISNKNVADRPAFQESSEYRDIKNLMESPETICIAHNAAFDEQILKNDGINPSNLICTFKVVRDLDQEGQFPMHKLQYLRYALDMDIDVPAHEAWSDVLVLEKLFQYEIEDAKQKWNLGETEILDKMIQITKEPLIFKTFTFGKHNGESIAEVAVTDRGYLEWFLKQKKMSETDETDWIYTLEKYLQ